MKTICLGEAARFINGAAFKPTDWEEGGLPIIRIQNLTGTGERFNYTTRQVKPDLIVEPGDLLVSWSATLDVFRWNGARGVLNQHIFKVLPASNVDPDYLFYALKSVISELSGKTHGSTMKHVVRGDFESTRVLMPELAEQRRIVDILSRAEGIVWLRREAQKKAAEIIPALFLDMFGDPATNPKEWEVATLLDAGASIRYGIGQPLPQKEGGVPFLRATNVKRGKIAREGLVFIDPEANPIKRNPPLHRSDIIVVRSGAYTGDIAQVGEEFEGAIAGYDLVLRPGENHLPEFLAAYLLLPFVQTGFIKKHKIRAAQPHLNAAQLGSITVLIPPKKLQGVFTERVEAIRSIQSQQVTATEKAETAFDALLGHTFSQPLAEGVAV